jgi:NAD(P)H-quinone oxidoreductase subunit 5
VLFVAAYAMQKYGAEFLVMPMTPSAGWLADAWIMTLFIVLFSSYWMLRYYPNSIYTKRISISMFAGFYLDEWTTRTTLRIWPNKLPVRANAKQLRLLNEDASK